MFTDFFTDFIRLTSSLPFVLKEVLVACLIFSLFMVLRKVITGYIFNLILKFSMKRNTILDKELLLAFEGPLRFFFIVLGLYAAIIYLPLSPDHNLLAAKIFRSTIIVLMAIGLYNLADANSVIFRRIQKTFDIQLDKILIPFLSNFLRIIIAIFAFTIIAQELNYDINGLIAGLGLGGLAIALAAKDGLANIFGGIIIILDKPFSIGDWISTSSVEGTVEEITFRSTKVRTFAQAMVTVPNSTLANEAITNWSRMGRRRITFNLGVTYTTPRAKLEACVTKIEKMLREHPQIHQETIFVNFDRFNESSLDIFLYFFTITTNWGEYLKVKEDVNLKIMAILEQEKVSIAFPSRSVYFETSLTSRETSSSLEGTGKE